MGSKNIPVMRGPQCGTASDVLRNQLLHLCCNIELNSLYLRRLHLRLTSERYETGLKVQKYGIYAPPDHISKSCGLCPFMVAFYWGYKG